MRTKSNSEHPLCELSKEEIAELLRTSSLLNFRLGRSQTRENRA